MSNSRNYILLYINGKKTKITGDLVFKSLSDFLRYEKQLVGTKVVCAEGDCGSCTVVHGRLENNKINYKPVTSCIKYIYDLDCTHIITVEGLKSNGCMNPIQESMVKNHGAQCGFCTPGIVVAMTSLLQNKEDLSLGEIKEGLSGNLCRCTGYESIVKSCMDVAKTDIKNFDELYNQQEIIEEIKKVKKIPVVIEHEDRIFFGPNNVYEAFEFKKTHLDGLSIISGGTDISLQFNKGIRHAKVIMSTQGIDSLKELKVEGDNLIVGSRVTLTELEEFTKDLYPDFSNMLKVFGSPQIRNSGTLAGNIANASPIADTLPFLYVMDALVDLSGSNGTRTVNINDFYKGYKILDLKPDEIITKITIPLLKENQTLKVYKISKRKDLDISTFTAGFLMTKNQEKIESIKIALGGVGPMVIRAKQAEEFLKDKNLTQENIKEAGKLAKNEIAPISDVRGSKEFRLQLAENIMKKFYFDCMEKDSLICQ
ncbi:MAG: xanthine dehydrogenase small subunit [Candidatus Sericytochromatia bacterium]